MYYYKVELGENLLGLATSNDLIKYQKKHNIFLTCDESVAQYVRLKDKIYHAIWLEPEPEELKGRYRTVNLILITEEEYKNLLKGQKSEQKTARPILNLKSGR